MEQVGQVLAQLGFREKIRHDELGRSALSVRTQTKSRPAAWSAYDGDELAEYAEPKLLHFYPARPWLRDEAPAAGAKR